MGGKRTRAGKPVLFCLALLGLTSGCSTIADWFGRGDTHEAMAQGRTLYARGDYAGALKQYQRAQTLAKPDSPSDAASFNIALIYADPRNPQRDDQKAIGAFQGVIARYPESSWADQSRVWIAALGELRRIGREMQESKLELEKSKQFVEKSKKEVEKSRLLVEQFKQEVDKLKHEVEKSKQVLEKSRQVDIEIEQKRRTRGK